MAAPAHVIGLGVALAVCLLALAITVPLIFASITLSAWKVVPSTLYNRFRGRNGGEGFPEGNGDQSLLKDSDDEKVQEGNVSDASSSSTSPLPWPSELPDQQQYSSDFLETMAVLERNDFRTYNSIRLEMLNEVLKFIESCSVNIPALRQQGLEGDALVDAIMAVTDNHPRARMPKGTTNTLGRAAVELIIRSEQQIEDERDFALEDLSLTFTGDKYMASALASRGAKRKGLIQCFDFLFGLAYWKTATA
ncbi:hypothetical protein FA95DRAFT_1610097 [Auriscalpium vulgare]|uniref:Uncharacterized protein n=1 Tax=Auriscalpium vulgare TaxID=40419 RepID=A0ACB8RER2_9AGAM|nr:hypothetical protein FA95DRAFT_1610097 [Auriscalpium vulgare]